MKVKVISHRLHYQSFSLSLSLFFSLSFSRSLFLALFFSLSLSYSLYLSLSGSLSRSLTVIVLSISASSSEVKSTSSRLWPGQPTQYLAREFAFV